MEASAVITGMDVVAGFPITGERPGGRGRIHVVGTQRRVGRVLMRVTGVAGPGKRDWIKPLKRRHPVANGYALVGFPCGLVVNAPVEELEPVNR